MKFCPKNALLLVATIAAFGVMSTAHADDTRSTAKAATSAPVESYDAAMIRTINRAWRVELGATASPVLAPAIRKASSIEKGTKSSVNRPI